MTYTEYVAILAGLDVAGVTKRYSAPPAQLSTAQHTIGFWQFDSGSPWRRRGRSISRPASGSPPS